ncbi:OSCP/delta subunit of ATPase [Dimargaris cristalligena]|uniref:ATP synthase subunit 5, mitochondrial n=1 Tax=Dimargaris cristalligena TaxID=215637 RepID=A0A4P9ZZV5_9FUNG|nr:OSCP/delta subunit of ATPase [Dimargaris cristalligena]|eukprot:RKP38978.1 OSCP/delta subunit of ATPase [Dimargaris cristalligena]
MSSTRATASFAQQLTRGYATATKSIQVPLALHGIEGRYATALYTAAAKKNVLPQVEADLTKLMSTIEKDAKLRQFLENPILGKRIKKEGLQSLAKAQNYNAVTTNFLDVLAENSRMAEASKVIGAYNSLMAAHRGEVQVTVTSSKALSANQLNKLKTSLTKGNLVPDAKSLTVNNKVNPSIVGGLIIEFGDKTIDMSLASRLAKLDKLLTVL